MIITSELNLKRGLEEYKGNVSRHLQGELSADQFRPLRLRYGVYAELPDVNHMVRIKIPAGLFTAEQLEHIADLGEKYARGMAHVTTRQDIQFHWVPLEHTPVILESLHQVGITTRGASGDSIRNVKACPFSGVCPQEAFDVTPYATAVSDYFLFHPLNLALPRKFKIAFSGCSSDCGQGSCDDLGFFAKLRWDDSRLRLGFAVFAAGGLGARPHLGQQILECLPAEDLLILCEAILRFQYRAGERKNRNKARMKFLLKKLGYAEYKRIVAEEMARVEEERGEELRQTLLSYLHSLPANEIQTKTAENNGHASSAADEHWRRTNTRPQKQAGFSAVTVKLPLGEISAAQMRTVSALARRYGDGSLRTSMEQNLVLPWISSTDLATVYAHLKQSGLAEPGAYHITDVISCPGADYCSLAITKSMRVGSQIRQHLRGRQAIVEKLGSFRIRISGCPNSCGQHHVGDIGLTGMVVRDRDGRGRPHYSILLGGHLSEGTAQLGRRLHGKYPEEDIPRIICAFADFYVQEREADEPFHRFVSRVGLRRFEAIARELVAHPIS